MLKIMQNSGYQHSESCQGEEDPWQNKTKETQTSSWEREWERQTCENEKIAEENLKREFNC